MSATPETLLRQALQLTAIDRAALVEGLITSLDKPDPELENADVTNILASATAATTQKIVENLNALHEEGLVIDKLDFVAACVSAYGRQTILDASLHMD